ncbi:MAG TPA: hemolysin III family protein [Nitrospirota bacterium]|nr:hemolysin III family protein [Nitrospirota bacterium]
MSISRVITQRGQSRKEEIANSISHGVGLAAAIIAAPFLIANALPAGNKEFLVGTSLFVATMVLLYLASALYHALPTGKVKQRMQVIEHSAIFLLIAGTYTPFTLGALRGAWGWTLLGLVWGLAIAGVSLKAFYGISHPRVFTCLYLFMGWLVLIAVKPLYVHIPLPGLVWLAAGGVAYTVGVAFYAAGSRLRYSHFIWHLFVMGGTACHYFAVFRYAA